MIGRSWRSVAPPVLAAAAVLGVGYWPARQADSEIQERRGAADNQIADLQRLHRLRRWHHLLGC